jgi:hypothetical protein
VPDSRLAPPRNLEETSVDDRSLPIVEKRLRLLLRDRPVGTRLVGTNRQSRFWLPYRSLR